MLVMLIEEELRESSGIKQPVDRVDKIPLIHIRERPRLCDNDPQGAGDHHCRTRNACRPDN